MYIYIIYLELLEEGQCLFIQFHLRWQMSLNLAKQFFARLEGQSGMSSSQLMFFERDSYHDVLELRFNVIEMDLRGSSIDHRPVAPAILVALASTGHVPSLPNEVCR